MSPVSGDLYEHSWTQERESCLSMLPSSIQVREGPGLVVVKLADGKPHRVPRRKVSLPYTFDGFRSNDNFLVIEMNYAFDCILGMPWLARYQPQIDWLARSMRRRHKFDVSEVFTHLLVSPSDWPNVTIVDRDTTTQAVHRASDGPLCTACAVCWTRVTKSPRFTARRIMRLSRGSCTRMQWLNRGSHLHPL